MQVSSNIIRTFWQGSPLSIFEELSLLSFARCGHEVELYAYSDLKVPTGIRLCDANTVLPVSKVLSNRSGWFKGSANFSDIFRYKILYEKGGIWADIDTLCLRSLQDLPSECVGWADESALACGIMKFPAGSLLCEELYKTAEALGEDLPHGESGPRLLTRVLAEGKHTCQRLPVSAFYPIHYLEAQKILNPEDAAYCEEKTDTSYCVHWWDNILNEIGIPKDALPPKGSFLHSKAEEVFGTSELKAWPGITVRRWIDNYEAGRRSAALIAQVEKLQNQLAESKGTADNLIASTSWRVTYPLRSVAAHVPAWLRWNFRRTLQAVGRVANDQKRRLEWLRRNAARESTELTLPNLREPKIEPAGQSDLNSSGSHHEVVEPTAWYKNVVAAFPHWPLHAEYQAACDRALQDLELVANFRPFSAQVPTVVCVARNEGEKLDAFIRHYEKLGVRSIHLIDNGSSDDTARIAVRYPCVTLWRTSGSYADAAYGQLWVGGLVRMHGLGKWVINVDADEFLVYSNMEKHGLADLQAFLVSQRQTRMLTPLVDMYSGPQASTALDGMLLAQAPYFDDKFFQGRPSYTCQQSQFGPILYGGARARLMSTIGATEVPCCRKVAIARWDASTAYANVHFPYPFQESPCSPQGALLHFKFTVDFASKVDEALATGEHWHDGVQYRRYREWLDSSRGASLHDAASSRLYDGPSSLINADLIAPIEWDGHTG